MQVERRSVEEREATATCVRCGAVSFVVFTPTANIHIPIHFQQVRVGGAAGGGGLSWSDFHDESERDMAKNPNVEKAERVFSMPGRGKATKKRGNKRSA